MGISPSLLPQDTNHAVPTVCRILADMSGTEGCFLHSRSLIFDTARQPVNSLNQSSNTNSHSFHPLTVCRLDNVKRPNITAILVFVYMLMGALHKGNMSVCVYDFERNP